MTLKKFEFYVNIYSFALHYVMLQHTTAIFLASAICGMQLILRSCGCGVGGMEQMVERNAARSSAW